jgi:hypothetical protein
MGVNGTRNESERETGRGFREKGGEKEGGERVRDK